MVFKRKHKKSWFNVGRDFIWPHIGFKRSFQYIKYRLIRLPHSARDIAMGLSFGCAISWTPTWGLHIVQCLIFCKITRANFPASIIGSACGNPWTFPLIIWISYNLGSAFMDITNLHQFFEWIGLSSLNVNNEYSPITSFIPTLVGGYMMALLTFPLFYYPFYYMIIGARKAKISASAKVAKFKNKHSKSDIIK